MDFSNLAARLSGNPAPALPLLFAGGVLTSLTPCVYPMIPITAAIVGGAQAGTTARAVRTRVEEALEVSLRGAESIRQFGSDLGFRTFLGCMEETSVGIAASAADEFRALLASRFSTTGTGRPVSAG